MSTEALVKADFRRMVNELIKSNGGEIRLSLLYDLLRNQGYHHSEIITNLQRVGILVDETADTASLEPRPMQLTLDAILL